MRIQQRWEAEKRLAHFAEFGEVKKRSGQRGDKDQQEMPPRHSEL